MIEKKIINKIHELAKNFDEVKFMEVCGTHTQTVAKYGIRSVLPKNIKLISGPGCPVCVTAQEDIDAVIELALNGTPIATYGDMMRVPGSKSGMCLDCAKAKGADIEVVYSIEDCFKISKLKKNLDNDNLVFFGIGFETTTPMTAVALKKGLTVYSVHKLVIPAMEAMLAMGELEIDCFIDPGHVSTIIGVAPYRKLKVPQVITGFEAVDVLASILMLLRQLKEGRCEVENEYARLVHEEGNVKALNLMNEVLEVADSKWRGFGTIPKSGLEVKNDELNAKIKYREILDEIPEPGEISGCACGEIIRGLKEPDECPLFRKTCTPDNPMGPCMVSSEGTCNIFYRYGG